MESDLDRIDNIRLIEDCLLHLKFELSRELPFYFRIAKEAYLILYRSMIEALKGTANLAVTGQISKERSYRYKMDNKPWQEIHKVPIKDTKKKGAWRFSQPTQCEKPKYNLESSSKIINKDYLISFFDALAMIQTECFMLKYANSKLFPLSDDDMKKFEWLHESIRNEYEHFVPKIYLSPIQDLFKVTLLSLSLSKKLLFESGNIIFYNISKIELEKQFKETIDMLNTEKTQAEA